MLNKLRFVLANGLGLLVCASAFGQNTKTVEAGRTYVKLSSDLVSALQSLGVTPGAVDPSKLRAGNVNFPHQDVRVNRQPTFFLPTHGTVEEPGDGDLEVRD